MPKREMDQSEAWAKDYLLYRGFKAEDMVFEPPMETCRLIFSLKSAHRSRSEALESALASGLRRRGSRREAQCPCSFG